MAPPAFGDIGKQSRDVFGKGYHFGVVKLEVKSKTSTGLEFTAGGTSNDAGVVAGSIETKYKCSEYGLSLTEKWNTDNTLNATLDLQDLGKATMPGLKLTLDGNFKPNTGAMAGKFKTEFKHERLVLNADMNLAASPAINLNASVGHGAWAAGYATSFDTAKSAITKNHFAVGYATKEAVLHCTCNDGKAFGGGIYHRISPKLETGVSVNSVLGGATNFGVGCKYDLGPDASIRAKVDNSSKVGLSYQQRLRDGVTVTLSSNIDGTKLNAPGHKLGLALEMSA
jgi:voltage-dependent anion channel protein 2